MIRLTVVIATYNRADSLLRTLRSLDGQTLDHNLWEIVVVNNNSKDDTEQKVSEFIEQYKDRLNIRLFLETEQGISPARNRGYREGSGEYFVFLDDDEEFDPELLSSYIDFFDSHPDAAEAGGEIIPMYDYDRPRWLSPLTEVLLTGRFNKGNKIMVFKPGKYPFGGNLGIRRSTAEKYGLFSPKLGRSGDQLLGGEEKDFANRLQSAGEKIYYLPAAKIYHVIPREKMTRQYLRKLSYMVGSSERTRSLNNSEISYIKSLVKETVKWGATLVFSLWYTVTLRPSKGGYLLVMRWNISRGLLGAGQ